MGNARVTCDFERPEEGPQVVFEEHVIAGIANTELQVARAFWDLADTNSAVTTLVSQNVGINGNECDGLGETVERPLADILNGWAMLGYCGSPPHPDLFSVCNNASDALTLSWVQSDCTLSTGTFGDVDPNVPPQANSYLCCQRMELFHRVDMVATAAIEVANLPPATPLEDYPSLYDYVQANRGDRFYNRWCASSKLPAAIAPTQLLVSAPAKDLWQALYDARCTFPLEALLHTVPASLTGRDASYWAADYRFEPVCPVLNSPTDVSDDFLSGYCFVKCLSQDFPDGDSPILNEANNEPVVQDWLENTCQHGCPMCTDPWLNLSPPPDNSSEARVYNRCENLTIAYDHDLAGNKGYVFQCR